MIPGTQEAEAGCLSQCSTAVKRHHDDENSYKREPLTGAGLLFQRFSSLSSRWEAWPCADRHGAGERAVSSVSGSTGSRK